MLPILLSALDPNLRTSYDNRGTTGGPFVRLLPCGDAAPCGVFPGRWWASPATAAALLAADADVKAAGGDGLRITSAGRDGMAQAGLRDKYDRWIACGSPAPGSSSFDSRTMQVAYACPPNRSQHQWGGAVDLGVAAIRFPGHDGNGSLSVLWDVLKPHGFRPVINRPDLGLSECWHFDHLGPLQAVRDLFGAHRSERSEYRDTYGWTAAVGCILAGTYQDKGDRLTARLVQARLLVAGIWVGMPDGVIGPKTLAGLATLKISATVKTPANELLTALDEQGIAVNVEA